MSFITKPENSNMAESEAKLLRWETLADSVRRFRCLYDKSCKDFKDINMKRNVWTVVAQEADFESAEDAEAQWRNLKIKYTRQRKRVRTASKYDPTSLEYQKAKSNLEVYKMLFWLNDFVQYRRRKTKSEMAATMPMPGFDSQGDLNLKAELDSDTDDIYAIEDDGNDDDILTDDETEEKIDDLHVHVQEQQVATDNGGQYTAAPMPSFVLNKQRNITPAISGQEEQLEKKIQQLKLLKEIDNSRKKDSEEKQSGERNVHKMNEDQLYIALLEKKLRKLSDFKKMHVKNQIDNIMFQAQMQESMPHQRMQPAYVQNHPASPRNTDSYSTYQQSPQFQRGFTGFATSTVIIPESQAKSRGSPTLSVSSVSESSQLEHRVSFPKRMENVYTVVKENT